MGAVSNYIKWGLLNGHRKKEIQIDALADAGLFRTCFYNYFYWNSWELFLFPVNY